MIRHNADGSITVGIIKEETKGAEPSAPSSDEKPKAKAPRKRKATTNE